MRHDNKGKTIYLKKRLRYKCARCGRTITSTAKKPKCPRKKPQCKGVMLLNDKQQTNLDEYI